MLNFRKTVLFLVFITNSEAVLAMDKPKPKARNWDKTYWTLCICCFPCIFGSVTWKIWQEGSAPQEKKPLPAELQAKKAKAE